MKKLLMALAAGLVCGAAAPSSAPSTNSCNVHAWGAARSTEIRAAPSGDARLLGTFRRRAAVESGTDINGPFPEFRIDAARGGWFRVVHADYGDYGDPLPRWRFYRGTGWVRGDQLGGQVLAGRLYAGPSERSTSRDYGKPADIVEIRRLLDCKGRWVKIEADIGTGWVNGICNNQVTICN